MLILVLSKLTCVKKCRFETGELRYYVIKLTASIGLAFVIYLLDMICRSKIKLYRLPTQNIDSYRKTVSSTDGYALSSCRI